MDKKDEEKEVAEKKEEQGRNSRDDAVIKYLARSTDMEEWLRVARKRRVAVRSVK